MRAQTARWEDIAVNGSNSQSDAPRLSVIVPAFNEEDRLPDSLRTILAYLGQRGDPAEVIVVDDGSDDRTVELAEAILAESDTIVGRVISNGQNRGKGYSVRVGMLESRGDVVLFTDSDLSTPIDDLPRLEAALEDGADIAVGSRDTEGSEVLRHQAWYRELAGKGFNVAIKTIKLSMY